MNLRRQDCAAAATILDRGEAASPHLKSARSVAEVRDEGGPAPSSLRATRWALAAASAVAVIALFGGAGCSVVRDQQSVGTYVDDSVITTRVKAKFAEDRTVSAMALSVETFKGVVQLSGVAKSGEERSLAEKLARETSGVVSVRNDIRVSG